MLMFTDASPGCDSEPLRLGQESSSHIRARSSISTLASLPLPFSFRLGVFSFPTFSYHITFLQSISHSLSHSSGFQWVV